jgi:hypothetical protein
VNAVLKRKTGDNGLSKAHITENGKNCLVFPEEFFKGPVTYRGPIPEWFTYLQNKTRNQKSRQLTPDASIAAQQAAETISNQRTELSKLYDLYVEYEFYRQRYLKRGGAIDLAFNPFMVPGFPLVVFDNRTSAFDLAGYAMNMTQTLSSEGGGSAGSMSTACNFSSGRTLREVLELMSKDMNSLQIVLGMAPAEPIDVIRSIGQDPAQAETFYEALFHGRSITGNRKAAFDITKAVGFVKNDGTIESIIIKNYAAEAAQLANTNAVVAQTTLENSGTSSIDNVNPEYTAIVQKIQPLQTQLNNLLAQQKDAQAATGETLAEKYGSDKSASQILTALQAQVDYFSQRIMVNEGVLAFWSLESFSTPTKADLKKIITRGAEGHLNSSNSLVSPDVLPYLVDPAYVSETLTQLMAYAEDHRYQSTAVPNTTAESTQGIYTNIDITREIEPTPEFEPFFTSYDAAMAYIARPICTLNEYIKFRHGEVAVEILMVPDANGLTQVRSPINKFGYVNVGSSDSSAMYYERIYKLRQGPALNVAPTAPENSQTGTVPASTPGGLVQAYDGTPKAVASTFVQTRNDWDSLLEEYRTEMYNQESPQR